MFSLFDKPVLYEIIGLILVALIVLFITIAIVNLGKIRFSNNI